MVVSIVLKKIASAIVGSEGSDATLLRRPRNSTERSIFTTSNRTSLSFPHFPFLIYLSSSITRTLGHSRFPVFQTSLSFPYHKHNACLRASAFSGPLNFIFFLFLFLNELPTFPKAHDLRLCRNPSIKYIAPRQFSDIISATRIVSEVQIVRTDLFVINFNWNNRLFSVCVSYPTRRLATY